MGEICLFGPPDRGQNPSFSGRRSAVLGTVGITPSYFYEQIQHLVGRCPASERRGSWRLEAGPIRQNSSLIIRYLWHTLCYT